MNIAREALSRVYKPRGKRTSPGQTCRDIKRSNPEFKNGYYWVDPNEGSALDAIQVYCKFDTEETCIDPESPRFNADRWTKDTREGQYFMEEVNNGKQFSYKEEGAQLRFLQLLSAGARQTITYSCLNSFAFGSRFTTRTGDDIDSAVGRYKRSTFIDVVDHCQVRDNQWHLATFSIRTNQTEVLPLVDMVLFDIGRENQQFGIDVGHVCFS